MDSVKKDKFEIVKQYILKHKKQAIASAIIAVLIIIYYIYQHLKDETESTETTTSETEEETEEIETEDTASDTTTSDTTTSDTTTSDTTTSDTTTSDTTTSDTTTSDTTTSETYDCDAWKSSLFEYCNDLDSCDTNDFYDCCGFNDDTEKSTICQDPGAWLSANWSIMYNSLESDTQAALSTTWDNLSIDDKHNFVCIFEMHCNECSDRNDDCDQPDDDILCSTEANCANLDSWGCDELAYNNYNLENLACNHCCGNEGDYMYGNNSDQAISEFCSVNINHLLCTANDGNIDSYVENDALEQICNVHVDGPNQCPAGCREKQSCHGETCELYVQNMADVTYSVVANMSDDDDCVCMCEPAPEPVDAGQCVGDSQDGDGCADGCVPELELNSQRSCTYSRQNMLEFQNNDYPISYWQSVYKYNCGCIPEIEGCTDPLAINYNASGNNTINHIGEAAALTYNQTICQYCDQITDETTCNAEANCVMTGNGCREECSLYDSNEECATSDGCDWKSYERVCTDTVTCHEYTYQTGCETLGTCKWENDACVDDTA